MARLATGAERADRRFLFADGLLLAVTLVSVAVGLSMTLAPESRLMRVYADAVAAVFWGPEPVPAAARAHGAWLYQVLGTTITGWGVMLAFVVTGPFRRREAWAWWAVLSSVLAWVALDVVVSLAAGVLVEVAFSLVFLVLVGVPLLVTWSRFRPPADDVRAARRE